MRQVFGAIIVLAGFVLAFFMVDVNSPGQALLMGASSAALVGIGAEMYLRRES